MATYMVTRGFRQPILPDRTLVPDYPSFMDGLNSGLLRKRLVETDTIEEIRGWTRRVHVIAVT